MGKATGHSSVPCLSPLRNRSESACPSLLEELGVRSARCCEMRRGKPFAFRFLGVSEASPGAAWACCFQLLLGCAAHRWLWDGCDGGAEAAAACNPGSCPLCAQGAALPVPSPEPSLLPHPVCSQHHGGVKFPPGTALAVPQDTFKYKNAQGELWRRWAPRLVVGCRSAGTFSTIWARVPAC